jgi:hypothetical protein
LFRKIAIDFDEPAAQVFANDAGLNLKLETRRCGAFTVADHMRAAADTVHSRTSYSNTPAFGVVFLQPCLRGVLAGEDLEVVEIANLLA